MLTKLRYISIVQVRNKKVRLNILIIVYEIIIHVKV